MDGKSDKYIYHARIAAASTKVCFVVSSVYSINGTVPIGFLDRNSIELCFHSVSLLTFVYARTPSNTHTYEHWV